MSYIAQIVFAALLLAPICGFTQQISIDKGVRVAGLWCFPIATHPKEYVYLSSQSRLAKDKRGRPQFSFIRYVMNKPTEATEGKTITAAEGGGILHFLVLYETPQSQVDNAQEVLRRLFDDDEILLRGPMVFKQGRYALVSSIINLSGEGTQRALLATGRAPVLEGNRIALSFDLEPEKATLLMQSFTMASPDVSLVFDMTFEGLTEAYDADLLIDWSEVRKNQGIKAGGSVYFVSADVEVMFDEMMRDNAIKLRSRGSDASMEALIAIVYDKLLELMFRPVEPEKIPQAQQGGLMDAINALTDMKDGPLSSRKTTGFGAYVGYQLKEMKSSGKSVLNFNHQSSVERHSYITFNIGDFYRRYGNDQSYFRVVNLGDPTFQQREVRVSLDGALLPEFEHYINSATLILKKEHESGKQTLREVVLDRNAINKDSAYLRMVYGWDGDQNRDLWLQYQYRTQWSFKGGGKYQTDWVQAETPLIDLFAPYERRTVQIVGSREDLKDQHVRAVVVKIEYPFFNERRREQIVIRPNREQSSDWLIDIILPLGKYEYDYYITWMLNDNRRLSTSGKDSTGVLFIDELPNS